MPPSIFVLRVEHMALKMSSGTSAFLLQPFSQSRIMVSFGSYSLAGIKGLHHFGGSGCDCQIALSYIDTNNVLVPRDAHVGLHHPQ